MTSPHPLAVETNAEIERARAFAEMAHHGKSNRLNGERYIRHPERVATYVRITARWLGLSQEETLYAIMAAWLHDTIEESWVTEKVLELAGMPSEVIQAVMLVTRRRDVPDEVYYERIKDHRIALATKWADILDHTDPHRLSLLSIEQENRFIRKYDEGASCLDLSPTPRQWWKQQGRSRVNALPETS